MLSSSSTSLLVGATTMGKLYYVRYKSGDSMFLCERCSVCAVGLFDVTVPHGRGLALMKPVRNAENYRCDRCGVSAEATTTLRLYYVRYERGDATFLCEHCALRAVQSANYIARPVPASMGRATLMPVYDSDLLDYRCNWCGVECTYFSSK